MKLSVIIIAKNAEKDIVDALFSVSFADEVVLVDSGSQDRTIDIAKKEGAKVFEHPSTNFSDMRNYGLQKVKGDWVLYIDTDERVTEELMENIKQIINKKSAQFAAYKVLRKNFYFGNHEWSYIEKMERFFKKDALKGWQGELHETPIVDGEIVDIGGFLLHYTHRDLSSMLAKTIEWSDAEARLRFDANHPKMTWWRFPRVMITAFFDSYVKQKGWKAGTPGIVESMYQSFSMLITYAKLWEMQKKKQ